MVQRDIALSKAERESGKPTVFTDSDAPKILGTIIETIKEINKTPRVFSYAGKPSQVRADDTGYPAIVPLNRDRAKLLLMEYLRFVQTREETFREVTPPSELVDLWLSADRSVTGLPVLRGIMNAPAFVTGGVLHDRAGYDTRSRMLYHPPQDFKALPVPVNPSKEDVAEAVELISSNVFVDFPFASEADRANAWALLLLGFMRDMIQGPTPLHWLDKATPGTGASLLSDAIALIQTGAFMPMETAPYSDDEWRKKLTAKLLSGASYVCFDNVSKKLDSPSLASVLTATVWEDRRLGATETLRIPVSQTFVLSGNNVKMSNELIRRAVRIKLDAGMERPEDRTGFKHTDLKGWIRQNRSELVRACLTVIRAWVCAGMPNGSKSKASFESWALLLSGVLENACIVGFLDNAAEVQSSDDELETLRGFIAAWKEEIGDKRVRARDLQPVMDDMDERPADYLDRLSRTKPGNESDALGKFLGAICERVFCIDGANMRLRKTENKVKGVHLWYLENVEGA